MESGDLVILKSGGPLMTIASLGGEYHSNMATCHWFTTEGELKTFRFKLSALKQVPQNEVQQIG